MSKIKIVFFLIGLNCTFSSFSQVKDAGFWTEFSVTKKFNPRLQCSITEGSRWNENWTHYATHYTQAGIQYKFSKNFSVAVAYRFGQRFTYDEQIKIRNRFQIDFSYEFKINKFKIGIQERMQAQYTDLNRSQSGNVPQQYLRSKITVKYDFNSRVTPFCSGEFFYNGNTKIVDNIRTRVGFEYELNKQHAVTLYYMLNQQVQVADPVGNYVLGLGYKFTF